MKTIYCIVFFCLASLGFTQQINDENTLMILEKISDKMIATQKEIHDFKVKVNKTSKLNHFDYGVKVKKHSNLNDQQLAELNQQLKQITDAASQNQFSYQRNYEFYLMDNYPTLVSYQHQNLEGENYNQQIAALLNESMKSELFDVFFIIKMFSDVKLKNQLIDETHEHCAALVFDDFRSHSKLQIKHFFNRLPKYLKKTKNYTYQIEAVPDSKFQKIRFEAAKEKADFSSGYLVFDSQTFNLIEVYTEKEDSSSAVCPASTSLITYEEQNNGDFLPTHLAFQLCEKCEYNNRKITFKNTKESPHPKEKFSVKQSGGYYLNQQIDFEIDYKETVEEIADKL